MTDQTEDPLVTLVKYDVQGVKDETLCHIFCCTPADLNEQRASPAYADLRAAYTNQDVEARLNRNAMWDHVEDTALSGLSEVLVATSDPRTLLAAARLANQAKRVAPTIQTHRTEGENNGPKVTIVRLRRQFTEALSTPEGLSHVVRREEVTALEASVGSDVIPTAAKIEALMVSAIGVDPRSASSKDTFGPGIELFGPDTEFFGGHA